MDQRPLPTSSSHPTLCRNGCGFFGNQATDGMCSKCHRDSEARKSQRETPMASAASGPVRPSLSDSVTTSLASARLGRDELAATPLCNLTISSTSSSPATSPSATPTQPSSPTSKTPKKNRCHTCKKKVGLTGFVCRCGHQFCPLHRYADTHQCTYDYKTSGREELGKHYPKIVAAKIEKL